MRHTPQTPPDEPQVIDLDRGFAAVDNERDPAQLEPGFVADAINVRIDAGEVRTRPGCIAPLHLNPSVPAWFGVGKFSDPESREWLLAAQSDKVWLLADGVTPSWQPLKPGSVITQAEFVQCFSRVVCFRGVEAEPLIWNGGRGALDWWQPVTPAVPEPDRPSFISPTPAADFGVVMADRLFVPISRDTVAWSDLLEPTRFDLDLAVARLNQGEDDAIVALAPYAGNRLIVFKDQSVHFLYNVVGDMSAVGADKIPIRDLGCAARRSVAEVGNDLMWLARSGVYRLSQTDQGGIRILPEPVSKSIQGWIDRINWNHAGNACACVAQDTYFLAVPLDDSTVNNAILVHDLRTGTWHGVDYYGADAATIDGHTVTLAAPEIAYWSPGSGGFVWGSSDVQLSAIPCQQLVTTDLFGQRTPVMSTGTQLIGLGHGTRDRIGTADRPVVSMVQTRGYVLGEVRSKQGLSVTLVYATRGARLSLSLLTNGTRQSQPVFADRVRDRRRRRFHGRGAWDATNAADDFAASGREDYSLSLLDSTRLKSGLPLGLFQEFEHAVPFRRTARWFGFRLLCTSGQMILRAVQADGLPARNSLNSAR